MWWGAGIEIGRGWDLNEKGVVGGGGVVKSLTDVRFERNRFTEFKQL